MRPANPHPDAAQPATPDDTPDGTSQTSDPDMPLEQVPPVQRNVPRLRDGQHRPPRLTAALAAAAALTAGLLAILGSAPAPGWTLTSGTLTTAEGQTVAAGSPVPTDTELQAGTDGAVLQTNGTTVETTPHATLEIADLARTATQTISLKGGSLVADTHTTLTIGTTTTAATGRDGTFRVDRDNAPRAATYSATADVAGDTTIHLDPLHQTPLRGNPTADPIILDAEDPWDQRHAADALAIDAHLTTLRTGLAATYGTTPQTPAFYRDFLGVTTPLAEFLPQVAPTNHNQRFGPPAETLIAAASVLTLAEHTSQPLAELTGDVVADRAAGGTWGVILTQHNIDLRQLRQTIDDALQRRADQPNPEPIIDEPNPTPDDNQPEPEPTPDPSPEPTPEPTPEPEPQPTPDPEPTPDPDPLPDPTPLPDPLPDPTPLPDPLPDPTPLPDPLPDPTPLPEPDPDVTEDPIGTIDDLLDEPTADPEDTTDDLQDTTDGLQNTDETLEGTIDDTDDSTLDTVP